MYMYLSHRVRRIFLSEACPQNLSPKKSLSFKDLRFLQKTKVDRNLTRTVLKQQKVLYEKHIGFLLQEGGLEKIMSRVEGIKSAYRAYTSQPITTSQGTIIHIAKKKQQEQQLLFPADLVMGQKDHQKILRKYNNPKEVLEKKGIQPSISCHIKPFTKKTAIYNDAPKRVSRTNQVFAQGHQGPKGSIDYNCSRDVPLRMPQSSTLFFPANLKEKGNWEKTPIYVSGPCKKNQIIKILANRRKHKTINLQDHNSCSVPLKGACSKGASGAAAPNKQEQGFSDFVESSRHYNAYRKPLTLFVQSIKVQCNQYLFDEKKQTPLSFPIKNVAAKPIANSRALKKLIPGLNTKNLVHDSTPVAFFTQKKPVLSSLGASFMGPFPVGTSYKSQLLGGEKKCLVLEKRSFSDVRYKSSFSSNISHPESVLNSESRYRNCRYLYNRESLKTCIVPQIFKNKKPISRAKTLLQERKKIALLYGQLAKKDINSISRKAMVAGFFEDNMFTFLESRVDVCVFRAGFSRTIAAARQLIRNGSVLVNGKKISSCKSRASPGDLFTFAFQNDIVNCYKSTTTSLYNLYVSSNLLTVSKIAYFREKYQQRNGPYKKMVQDNFESLLFKKSFEFFPYHYLEQSFCHSLYWGFFIYKLYKIEPFRVNKNGFDRISLLFKSDWENSQIKNRTILSCYSNLLAVDNFHKLSTNSCYQHHSAIHDQESYNNGKSKAFGANKGQGENIKNHMFFDSKHCLPFTASLKKKHIVFFNLYTQYMLKKLKVLKVKATEKPPKEFNLILKKNMSSSNLWAVWGQKPLHLEISHKMGAFIYMYKPQKIISPVCLDWI